VVNHQTVDDMLERDGRGDEIFVRGDWYDYRDHGHFMSHGTVKSAVFGERGQFRAGGARPGINSADDQPGGLVTNDSYSPGGDNFSDTLSSQRGNLPMLLWEGTLRPGDEIMIVPSIWEWDGPETSRAEIDWNHWLGVQAPRLQLGAARVAEPGRPIRPSFIDGAIVSDNALDPLDVYDMGTRPIGAMQWEGRRGPGMRAPAIILSYQSAFSVVDRAMMFGASVTNPDGTVTSVEYPGPSGGFTISFADPPQLEGVYTLYLRLVRVW
jgi:hypothetical protein